MKKLLIIFVVLVVSGCAKSVSFKGQKPITVISDIENSDVKVDYVNGSEKETFDIEGKTPTSFVLPAGVSKLDKVIVRVINNDGEELSIDITDHTFGGVIEADFENSFIYHDYKKHYEK